MLNILTADCIRTLSHYTESTLRSPTATAALLPYEIIRTALEDSDAESSPVESIERVKKDGTTEVRRRRNGPTIDATQG